MKVKQMLASLMVASTIFCVVQRDNTTEAVKTVAEGSYGSVLVDEASIYWQSDKEFNALIYQMSPSNEVLKRGVYTFQYVKEYKNWYYHPLNDKEEIIRVDVDRLEKVPTIAMEEKQKKYKEKFNKTK
jgi:hypothetical protein